MGAREEGKDGAIEGARDGAREEARGGREGAREGAMDGAREGTGAPLPQAPPPSPSEAWERRRSRSPSWLPPPRLLVGAPLLQELEPSLGHSGLGQEG